MDGELKWRILNFRAVQQVFDGRVRDETWTTQKLKPILLDDMVDALCAALVEAGAIAITGESMFDCQDIFAFAQRIYLIQLIHFCPFIRNIIASCATGFA